MNATAPRPLTFGDLVLSQLHRRMVRFSCWTPDGYAEVRDVETYRVLPDLVHATQIR